ncbi:hypothetical protein MBANPS3_012096, partial [Mucor bainieri]
MSQDKENAEEEFKRSEERTHKTVRQFIQVSFGKEAKDRVAVLRENLVEQTGDTNITATAAVSK